jgi:hypothetical protein
MPKLQLTEHMLAPVCRRVSVQVTKALLDSGALIEATDNALYTPLWRAAYYGECALYFSLFSLLVVDRAPLFMIRRATHCAISAKRM